MLEHAETLSFSNYTVTLSPPAPVKRAKGHLWFPTVFRLAGGELVAIAQTNADIHTGDLNAVMMLSADGGLHWRDLSTNKLGAGGMNIPLPSGEALLLPYYFRTCPDGMQATGFRLAAGGTGLAPLEEPVTVTGWTRPHRSFAPELGYSGFVSNRPWVRLQDGGYLGTCYGYYAEAQRFSLVAISSRDGVHWAVRSTIADEHSPLQGAEGPCEAALCRLTDGRLMCIFRLGMDPLGTPYGQAWSNDDGQTWTEPVAMPDACSVEPSLATLPDGVVALSGGRPGLYCWLNRDGGGRAWDRIDLLAHHNRCHPEEPIPYAESFETYRTTSYTEIIPLDDRTLLCVYDRIPCGWNPVPAESEDANSIWAVRIRLEG